MTAGPASEPILDADWRAFVERPAAYADPARLALCFDGAIGEAACERMLDIGRLQPRLSRMLADRYGLSDAVLPPAETGKRMIALSTAEDLGEIALRAGAVFWANAFAGIIVNDRTAALDAALGDGALAIAATNRDLAGPVQPLDPLDTLRERVFADGWRCLGAWCLSAGDTGRRVRLKLPPDPLIDEPDVAFAATGPAIVARVVSGA
jgi:hypothetical protein